MMKTNNTQQPVKAGNFLQSAAFATLLEASQQFCEYIETDSAGSPHEFVQEARKLVTALYAAALQIPALSYDKPGNDFDNYINEEIKTGITKSIYSRIPFQYYWITLEPFQLDGEIETGLGDLGDDLLDIYKDLKQSLLVYSKQHKHAREEALWLLEFGFKHHWGQHCVDALQVIHHYLHDPK